MTAGQPGFDAARVKELVQCVETMFRVLDRVVPCFVWLLGLILFVRMPWAAYEVTATSFWGLVAAAIILSFLTRAVGSIARVIREYPYYPEETGRFMSCHGFLPVLLVIGLCFLAFSSPGLFAAYAVLVVAADGCIAWRLTQLEDGLARKVMQWAHGVEVQAHFEEEWEESMTEDEQLVHQQTRRVQEDGGERVEGLVRVRFDSGQELQTVHLAFCPPLDNVPDLEYGILSDDDVHLKATLVMPYGARLEMKRSLARTQEAENAKDADSVIIPLCYAAQSRK
ncbi:MAG: hypothetical protein Q4G68_09275 [Planctomycetia bacterium]|nr:hypothetical protein [Planctomycetia bacterium]